MSSYPKAKRSRSSKAAANIDAILVLRLYVADRAPNSALAIANLAVICKEHLAGRFELEIIDVLEQPLSALADGILITPSLAKLSPAPATTIVGNLSDTAGVLQALGIT
jgi:circadian clock protein KaiB